MLVVDVDDDGFIGFGALAGLVLAIKDARAADAEFKAFAVHRFDEHAELKLAAARDFNADLVGASGDADRDLGFGFAVHAVAKHAARHLAALAPRTRAEKSEARRVGKECVGTSY